MPSQTTVCPTNVSPSRAQTSAIAISAVAVFLAFTAAGCARHRTVALPPVTQAPQPAEPATIPPLEATKPAESTPPATAAANPPETQTPPVTPPASTTPPADAPSKPDTPPKKPVAEPPRPPAPQISPELSATDVAELQKQTNKFITDAQQNLHHADGRDLNANQRDMVDKIHGFLNQVHEAIKNSDWTRARNLSQKAYLLSVELANSLS